MKWNAWSFSQEIFDSGVLALSFLLFAILFFLFSTPLKKMQKLFLSQSLFTLCLSVSLWGFLLSCCKHYILLDERMDSSFHTEVLHSCNTSQPKQH